MFVDNFPEGFFFIRCKATDMALDVNDGGMLNDYTMIIWPQKMVDSINQLWMHEDGFLINRKSGLVLDIRGGDIKKDKAIIQYARKPGLAHNQRWQYKDGYIFPAASPNLVLDIRGGEYKDAASIFLNSRLPGSNTTQQWLIQPFQDTRSKQDLALLRPPPLQKHLTEFPQPEDLCDYHRQVYHENMPTSSSSYSYSGKQIAGAAAFEGIRRYLLAQKKKDEPIVTPQARETIQSLVAQQMAELKDKIPSDQQQPCELVRTAEQAAASYFAREYESSSL
ncbi:ricin B lectin domain-containing protein [Zychaea mexicana]|uniref:ricin B lectin domain-containing protein n=1 Tax=Zychaea mexicana TaxID=64656 RepID=UPI0022FF4032|nr:ricin B lectin domain-containing protein [Zychaea mexicana]KAI9495355.1 ricin B lectin domain-containing protein [Zychaea mexicana]